MFNYIGYDYLKKKLNKNNEGSREKKRAVWFFSVKGRLNRKSCKKKENFSFFFLFVRKQSYKYQTKKMSEGFPKRKVQTTAFKRFKTGTDFCFSKKKSLLVHFLQTLLMHFHQFFWQFYHVQSAVGSIYLPKLRKSILVIFSNIFMVSKWDYLVLRPKIGRFR